MENGYEQLGFFLGAFLESFILSRGYSLCWSFVLGTGDNAHVQCLGQGKWSSGKMIHNGHDDIGEVGLV